MRLFSRLFLILAFFPLSLAHAEQAQSLGGGKVFGSSGGSLVDKAMNPAISISGLVMGAGGLGLDYNPVHKGLFLREIEAVFTAAIDPYFLGNVVINKEVEDDFFGVEEAYFVTLGIPMVTIKGGKFRSAFGKDNPLHTHALPLIDRPIATRTLLSTDSLDSIGLEASALIPMPWYMELTLSAVSAQGGYSPKGPSGPFKSPNPEALAGTARLDNLWDLSDVTTLGVGMSYAGGDNQLHNITQIFGGDITFKYRSGRGKGDLAIAWINEFIGEDRPGLTTAPVPDWQNAWGFYSTALVRFYQRTWVGGRFDYLKTLAFTAGGGDSITTGENILFAYVPSEFSAIQLQGGLVQSPGKAGSDWVALLQYNMTIGSHPAHAY